MRGLYIATLMALTSLAAGGGLKLYSCASSSHPNKIQALILDVNPDPIELPGTFTIGATLEIMEDLTSSYSAHITAKRQTLWLFHVGLPCVSSGTADLDVGSCDYPDLCHILDIVDTLSPLKNETQCPDFFDENIVPAAPCHCPIPKGMYKIKPSTATVKSLPALLSLVTDAVYDIKITVKDTQTGNQIMCYEGELEIGNKHFHNQTAVLEAPVHSGQDLVVG